MKKKVITLSKLTANQYLQITTDYLIEKIYPIKGKYQTVAIERYTENNQSKLHISTDSSAHKIMLEKSIPKYFWQKFKKSKKPKVLMKEFKRGKTIYGNDDVKIMANGLYFNKIPPYDKKDPSQMYFSSIHNITNENILQEKLDPSLCETISENDGEVEIVCASANKKNLYSYYFSIATNEYTPKLHLSLIQKKGIAIYSIEDDDIKISSVAGLTGQNKLAIALSNGDILLGRHSCDTDKKIPYLPDPSFVFHHLIPEEKSSISWHSLSQLSELGLFDAELHFSKKGILIVYSQDNNTLASYDINSNILTLHPCPKISNLHLSLDGNYLSALSSDSGQKNEVFILSLNTMTSQKVSLPIPLNDFVLINNDNICYAAENKMYFANNFIPLKNPNLDKTSTHRFHFHFFKSIKKSEQTPLKIASPEVSAP